MNHRIFFWNILTRVGLLIATILLFIWMAETKQAEIIFTLLVGSALIILQVYLLTRYVLGVTRILEQFIEAIAREESPELQFDTGKALFRRLKERSNTINRALKARRLEKEKDDRILFHVINLAEPGLFCFTGSGEVVFVNESARKLIGDRELTHLDDLRKINKKLWSSLLDLKSGTPRVLRLFPVRPPGGEKKNEKLLSLRLKEVKIFDEQYRLFSLQDIQEELHKNESDSWQKIIRVLTHEIMNAVSPMLSLSSSLQKRIRPGEGKEGEKILDGLKMIENTGKGLLEFVEEYRRLSLLPPPGKKKLLLKDALDGILLMFEDEARKKNIQLGLEMEDGGVHIHADPQQLEMVLLNLMRNAFDSFAGRQKDKRVTIRTLGKENRIQIQLEDNGSGIKEELLDQVFVPFFTTKEQGSGIGLSLARQIMHNHEGSIQLDSGPGRGTAVTLLFA